jgi:hypothetical protein
MRMPILHHVNGKNSTMPEREATELSGGKTVEGDHREIDPKTGQQKGYVVLTEAERAKGFVRPVRREYVHVGINPKMDGNVFIRPGEHGCGTLTRMSVDIAETYARKPDFYSGTFCVGCGTHRPLAEFYWAGTAETVGS